MSGGETFEKKKSFVGDFAIATFSKVAANICFLGVGGINEKGITTYVLSETAINRTILERTRGPRVIIAEGYKIGRENNFMTSDLSLMTHLITDNTASHEAVKVLSEKGIEITIVDQQK